MTTVALPITINSNDDLQVQFPTIQPVINKLAAQFNFQTLTANWYADEDNILLIELSLETPKSFECRQTAFAQLSANNYIVSDFSDDVICCTNTAEPAVNCIIAVTYSEIELLTQYPKLLVNFTQAKLHKVLNLIAQQHSLTVI